jgi:hypothetical protein
MSLLNKDTDTYEKTLGVLLFHQGYTDVINSLGLIGYFKEIYNLLVIISHPKNATTIQYYCKNKKNVFVYIENNVGVFNEKNERPNENGIKEFVKDLVDPYTYYDVHYEYIGVHDIHRRDKYNRALYDSRSVDTSLPDTAIINNKPNYSYYYVNKFYELYNISYINRIEKFEWERDKLAEGIYYKNNIASKPYILIHDTPEATIPLERKEGITYYQLSSTTSLFFDAIKALEEAEEIHVIDSVWAAVCYHLDAKYKILKDKKLYVHCIRANEQMFKYPTLLSNWNIISYNTV